MGYRAGKFPWPQLALLWARRRCSFLSWRKRRGAGAVRAAATERQRVRAAERRFGEIREVARAIDFRHRPGAPGTSVHDRCPENSSTIAPLTYLDRLSPDSAGDVALQQELATGYAHLATVQGMPDTSNLGDEAGARSSLNKSLQLIRASLAADPGNADGVVQYVRTLQLSGQMELTSGDPAAALPAHKQALREIDLLLRRGTPHPYRQNAECGGRIQSISGHELRAAISGAANPSRRSPLRPFRSWRGHSNSSREKPK